jgi:hypothetical protein
MQSIRVEGGALDKREARSLLADVGELTQDARGARRLYWFPLVLFGAATLGSLPLYVRKVTAYARFGTYSHVVIDMTPAFTFWFFAAPAIYLMTAVFYRRRALRVGVEPRIRPFVAAGVPLFILASPLTAIVAVRALSGDLIRSRLIRFVVLDLAVRGLNPSLVIAVSLLVVAWLERSRLLLVIVGCFLALAFNVVDWVDQISRIWFVHLPLFWPSFPHALLPSGLFLLIAGALVWRRSHHVST